MTTVGNNCTVDFNAGKIIIDSSNIDGTLVVRGVVEVDDSSAGTTVVQEAALARSSISDVVWDEILPGSHDISGSSGKLLQTAGTGGVDIDVLAAGVWNRDPSLHLSSGTMGWIQNQELITSQSVDKIRAMTCGRWILSGSQMIFYDDDNVTEITRFNLLDTEGDPFFSEANAPAQRVVTGSA